MFKNSTQKAVFFMVDNLEFKNKLMYL